MKVKVAVLSNNGEIMKSTMDGMRTLKRTGEVFGHRIDIEKIDAGFWNTPRECTRADAVVLGSRSIETSKIEHRLGTFAKLVLQSELENSNLCELGKKIERICPGIKVSSVERGGQRAIAKTPVSEKISAQGRSSSFINLGSSGIDIHGTGEDSVVESIISSIMILRCTLDMQKEAEKLEEVLADVLRRGVPEKEMAQEVINGLN